MHSDILMEGEFSFSVFFSFFIVIFLDCCMFIEQRIEDMISTP